MGREAGFSFYIHRAAYQNRVSRELAIHLPQPPGYRVEREERSLYVRALAPEVEDTLFVVGESGTTYEINLSTSDNPDQTVVISYGLKSLQAQAERAGNVPALDLMRSMMRGLPVDGYEIIKADKKEVYRDAYFSIGGAVAGLAA
jgi:hypothetical protein